jgi:hypothetical protein
MTESAPESYRPIEQSESDTSAPHHSDWTENPFFVLLLVFFILPIAAFFFLVFLPFYYIINTIVWEIRIARMTPEERAEYEELEKKRELGYISW